MKATTILLFLFAVSPLLAATSPAQSTSETVHLQVLLNGTPVGANDWIRSPDGTFKGKTELKIGSLDIVTQVSGQFQGAHLQSGDVTVKNPAGQGTFTYANGQVTAVRNGKKTIDKFAPKDDLYMGNL